MLPGQLSGGVGVDSGAAFATNIALQHSQPVVDYSLSYANLANSANQRNQAQSNAIRARHSTQQTKNWSAMSSNRRNPFERRRNDAAEMMMGGYQIYNAVNPASHQMHHHYNPHRHHQQQQQHLNQLNQLNLQFQNQLHHAQLGQMAPHFLANPYLTGQGIQMPTTFNTGYAGSFQLPLQQQSTLPNGQSASGNSWDPAMSTNVSDALSESTGAAAYAVGIGSMESNNSKQNSSQNMK
jgi:hypothetical protein